MVNLDESIEKEIKSIIGKYQKREVKHLQHYDKEPQKNTNISYKTYDIVRILIFLMPRTLGYIIL